MLQSCVLPVAAEALAGTAREYEVNLREILRVDTAYITKLHDVRPELMPSNKDRTFIVLMERSQNTANTEYGFSPLHTMNVWFL